MIIGLLMPTFLWAQENIQFEDALVKQLCVQNWDTNGDGELSTDEAAAVTDLGEVFYNQQRITNFDELRYFTGLTEIGSSAFFMCVNLTSIQLPVTVTAIRSGAFSYCWWLPRIQFPDALTTIESSAFSGCEVLDEITFPESLTTIGDFAFGGMDALRNVFIPYQVSSIGVGAFYGKSLAKLEVDERNTYYDSREQCNGIIETATNKLIAGSNLTKIPASVTAIAEYVFIWCTFNSIQLPPQLETIGHHAFCYCENLQSIDFPESLRKISNLAFKDCKAMTSINIPNGVSLIGSEAFSGCESLTSVTVNYRNPIHIGEDVFSESTYANAVLYIPTGSRNSYENTSSWNRFQNIEEFGDAPIPTGDIIQFEDPLVKQLCVQNWDTNGDGELSTDEAAAVTDVGRVFTYNWNVKTFNEFRYFTGVTRIGGDAFHMCGLTSIDLPANVKEIGGSAFNETDLTSTDGGVTEGVIVIPDGVTTLEWEAFACNPGFTSARIPASVTSIYAACFRSCANLATFIVDPENTVYRAYDDVLYEGNTGLVVYPSPKSGPCIIPEGVETIFAYAFYDVSVNELTLPSTLKTMGSEYFIQEDLQRIFSYSTNPPQIDEYTFREYNFENTILYVPVGTKAAYQAAEIWSRFQNIEEFGNPVSATFDDNGVLTVSDGTAMDEALANVGSREWVAENITAIIWDNDFPLTAEMLEGITNPNLLIYVKDAAYAPQGFNNIIVNDVAESIILVDVAQGNGDFHCPREFQAKTIVYDRNFTQTTKVGVSRGWESIALPFDVQSIVHETKGAILPFGSADGGYNFWLRRMGNNGLEQATRIEANRGYVISMPNSNEYPEEYRLNGVVRFAAQQVVVPVTQPTAAEYSVADESVTLIPVFRRVAASDSIYALNVGETRGGYPEGSVFERALRDVRPFEAYTTHRAVHGTRARYFSLKSLGADNSLFTAIKNISRDSYDNETVKVYNLSGVLIREGRRNEAMRNLPKGVYIVGGQRVIVSQ